MANLMREYHIKVADEESEDNLRAVLYGYGRLIEDLYAKLQQLDPDFDSPAWYINHFQLSEDQDREIFMHLYHGDNDVHDHATWIQAWFERNVYQIPFEMAERVTRSYLRSIADAKNLEADQ